MFKEGKGVAPPSLLLGLGAAVLDRLGWQQFWPLQLDHIVVWKAVEALKKRLGPPQLIGRQAVLGGGWEEFL
ncbi:MAG TPA: hypothetical protein GXX25_07220 [Desulfotomaculum sp.]|nr:hypothetical protein [Desulfotomaculum sp.]